MKNRILIFALVFFALVCLVSVGGPLLPVFSQTTRQPNYQILVKSLEGDLPGVRGMLREGVDPNTPPGPNDMGMTALMFAALEGHSEIAALLAQEGADLNAVSDNGMTPLMYASFRGNQDTVQILLNKGADPDLQAEHGTTALMYAVNSGHVNVARLLAEVSDQSIRNTDGDTALQVAIKHGSLGITRALLTDNTAVEEVDSFGQTPLMNASRKGLTLIVLRLLDKGASVNARDTNGKTALLKAYVGEHRAVIQVLRARGGTL